MKNIKIGLLCIFILVTGIIFCVIVSNSIVLHSAEKTIRANENVSKEIYIDRWIVKHDLQSDWYVIGYMFKVPRYVCTKHEKETTPWNCSNIPYDSTLEYIWFNTQTKEIHDAWSEIF